ncbi:hypothetical protein F0521_20650 [Ferrimonas sp. YFM]|nr:hypothetical protein F0521_20650 [Ferrimonas sp. YFM]
MALRMAHMATRMIPDSKDWDGFYFGRDGRLHTPVARLSFSGNELNFQHYEKQFAANDRRARAALEKQLRAVRSEDERKKAIQEIEFVLETLKGLQRSPLLATEGVNIQ